MDFLGVSGDYDGVDPFTPPPKRATTDFLDNTGSSMGVPRGHQAGGYIDLDAIDLNSQAPNWTSLTGILQSSSIPNFEDADAARAPVSIGTSRPIKPSSQPAAPQCTSWSANAATMATKPFCAPRTVGASTRAARGTRRGATTSGRTTGTPRVASTKSGIHATPGHGADAARIDCVPSLGGSVGSEEFNEGFIDGSSFPNINTGSHRGRRATTASCGNARHPVVLPEESCSRGKSRKRAAVAWPGSMLVLGEDEDAQEGFGDGSSNGDLYDKANWSVANTTVFCDICVEEIRAGNINKGFISSKAYKNIADKYHSRTRLRHSKQQLKNRWQGLKRLSNFWLSVNKHTGNGSIYEDDEFWETNRKWNTEWQSLRYGPPEFLDQLEIMYEHIAVDGSTSCIPGEHAIGEGYEGDEDDAGGRCHFSQPSNHRSKGGNNTNTCATSP